MPVTLPHGLIYPIAATDPITNYPAIEQGNYGILDSAARMIWYVGGDNHITQNARYDVVDARWEYWAAGIATRLTLPAAGHFEFYDAPAGAAPGNPITWTLRFMLTMNGDIILIRQTVAPGSPGIDRVRLYCLAGTVSGLSIRGKAGATGAEFIIMDDIPT